MPFLSPDQKRKYPNISTVIEELPLLGRQQKKVFDAYQMHTRFQPEEAIASLSQRIMIPLWVQLVDNSRSLRYKKMVPITADAIGVPGYARYQHGLIKIHPAFADMYEALMKKAPGTGTDYELASWSKHPSRKYRGVVASVDFQTAQKRARLLMESKILHEMVHWALHIRAIQESYGDEGERFERRAYGRMLGATDLGIWHLVHRPGNF